DRLAIVFRNIANTESVGKALTNENISTFTRYWSNILEKANNAKKVVIEFAEEVKNEVQNTALYQQVERLRKTTLGYLTQLSDFAVEHLGYIRNRVEEIPLVRDTIETIKNLQTDITNELNELNKIGRQFFADT